MFRRWFWGALSLFLVTAALQGQSRESVLKALSQDSKWSPADKPIQYDEKNIEIIAGKRATTVKHYGFAGVTMQNWSGPNGAVRLTLYEMADASAAYGLFTLERSEHPGLTTIPVGAEGFSAGNRLLFWQSKYLVKLEGAADAAESLARSVSENIFGRSWKPPVSNHLPPENLVRGSERYIVDETSIGREFELNQ